ncbi:MAG: RIP metalloprotease RseP [Verrucomicrobiota bacterium]
MNQKKNSLGPLKKSLLSWLVIVAVLLVMDLIAIERMGILLESFRVLVTFIVAFVVFSITVLVHEWGHFVAAKQMGLVVERFAIGFGPKVFGWKRGDVEYALNWLPFGGFVQLPQMAAMDMVEGKSETDASKLPPASPWAKSVTAFYGPLFSFLLAVVLAFIVWGTGIPQSKDFLTTTIGYVEPNSPAAKAGLQPGDQVLKINNQPVTRWAGRSGGVTEAVLLSVGKTVKVEVKRNEKVLTFNILPEKDPEMEGLRNLGFEKYFARTLIVDMAHKGSPAEQAGLREGDQILQVDGKPVYSVAHLNNLVVNAKGALKMLYLRDGKRHIAEVTPQKASNYHYAKMLGISFRVGEDQITQVDPWTMITNSMTFIYKTLRAVSSPDSDVGLRHLSGPIGIFDKLMMLLTIDPRLVIYFGVVLNVNLAVINLFPIPVLDGGHIILCIIEAIRRRPMEPKILQIVQTGFFVLLMGLFLFITFYDVRRVGERVIKKPKPFELPKFK